MGLNYELVDFIPDCQYMLCSGQRRDMSEGVWTKINRYPSRIYELSVPALSESVDITGSIRGLKRKLRVGWRPQIHATESQARSFS